MKTGNSDAKNLVEFINSSPTAFHAVDTCRNILEHNGFGRLSESDDWHLTPGGKYFVIRNDSALTAFIVGKKNIAGTGFRIAGSHTDSPGFKLKPSPITSSEKHYLKLNTEVYGGPILATWLDRPLSIAGRVIHSSGTRLKTRLVDLKRPICIIPNLAIHMNRDVNKGVELNRQVDTLPLLGLSKDSAPDKETLSGLVSDSLKIRADSIMSMDLFLYDTCPGSIAGMNNEFISSARIDNLQAVNASVEALTSIAKPDATVVAACFDNEEIGSATGQGADSPMLSRILERITTACGGSRDDYFRAVHNSMMISVDGAHAVHPNRGEKCDPTSRPVLNGGLVIKTSANMSYSSDAHSIAIFRQICTKKKIPVQFFANRSDERGGSTIGPISSTQLGMTSIDIGIPMLAMHSIRELAGTHDHSRIISALCAFYQTGDLK